MSMHKPPPPRRDHFDVATGLLGAIKGLRHAQQPNPTSPLNNGAFGIIAKVQFKRVKSKRTDRSRLRFQTAIRAIHSVQELEGKIHCISEEHTIEVVIFLIASVLADVELNGMQKKVKFLFSKEEPQTDPTCLSGSNSPFSEN